MDSHYKEMPQLDSKERLKITKRLNDAEASDLAELKSQIEDYVRSPDVPIVTSALDCIGRCQLLTYKDLVVEMLNHGTALVRVHAWQTLYDLEGKAVLDRFSAASDDENLPVVLTRHILTYLITKEKKVLEDIIGVLQRDYDYYFLSYLMMSVFESYIDFEDDSNVVDLLRQARAMSDKNSEFYQDVTDVLRNLD